jgi:WD40 repeat protein
VFVKNISAHKGGFVSSIRFVDYKLYTGGKDGDIKIWTGLGEEITCEKTVSFGSMIRAIDCKDGNMLVGTRDGTLTVVGEDESRKEIMHSHNDGETWGLASFDANCVITSGDDNQVIVWDVEERKRSKVYGVSSREAKAKKGGASSITNKPASQCARAVCLGPNGETIVAANDGVVHVHCADGSNVKLEESSEWIECLTVSPCGKFLAVGSHDNKVRVYSCDGWGLLGSGGKHSSYIMALDWS